MTQFLGLENPGKITASDDLPTIAQASPLPVSPLSRAELRLVAVMQTSPRIAWNHAAEVLGVSPQSVAATWASLAERGLAWVTLQHSGVGSQRVTAFLGVNHSTSSARRVQADLLANPHVQSIELFAQGRDLVLTAVAPGLGELMADVVEPVRTLRGVSSLRTWLATGIHHAAYQHFEHVLSPDELRHARQYAHPATSSAPLAPQHLATVRELMRDGRIQVTELARRTGVSTSTAHRHLWTVLGSQSYHLRLVLSAVAGGSPVMCQWFARLPGDRHVAAAQQLARLPSVHLLASVTGPANFVITAALPTLADVLTLERSMSVLVPELALLESLVTLQAVKRWGWELDVQGRRTGRFVEPPVW